MRRCGRFLPWMLRSNQLSSRAAHGSATSHPLPPEGGLGLTPNLETLFNYTSGRWLWNEQAQLVRRQVRFDWKELVRVATSTSGSQACVQFTKLSEGQFNKVYLLVMDSGKEMVAKVPCPNAGFAHYNTASEVATMDYMRNTLGLPVPQVYAWASQKSNPVGAEYILMEKVQGLELSKVWDKMDFSQKTGVVMQLADFETSFASIESAGYGSLYYPSDIPVEERGLLIRTQDGREFAVGPSTDRDFFDHGRSRSETSRGPCMLKATTAEFANANNRVLGSSFEEYVRAILHRELACVRKFRQFPYQQGFYNRFGQYSPTAERKTRVLQRLEKVVPYLKPHEPDHSRPVLWHTDLHSDNVFVDIKDPTKITAIMDWQAVHLAPLFLQAQHPTFLEFDGEIPDTYDVKSITLPRDYESLSETRKLEAQKLRSSQLLWKLYELQLLTHGSKIKSAIKVSRSIECSLVRFAGVVASDGELQVESLLIALQDEWDKIGNGDACPIHFTEQERREHEEDLARLVSSVEVMTEFLHRMGAERGWQGWISHEQYTWGKDRMDAFQEEFYSSLTDADKLRWSEIWPFRDEGEERS